MFRSTREKISYRAKVSNINLSFTTSSENKSSVETIVKIKKTPEIIPLEAGNSILVSDNNEKDVTFKQFCQFKATSVNLKSQASKLIKKREGKIFTDSENKSKRVEIHDIRIM